MLEVHGGTDGKTNAPAGEDSPVADPKPGTLIRARRAVLTDDRLAKQAAGGDIGAFETIFSRYRDDLYRFCVGILREPQDAQDAVQNTMMRAMRALPGERRQMQLKPWLYRIAHNEAVELRRRERPVEELPVTVDDVGALTDERAEENGRLRTLLADIADLPERQRASLVMREVNGLGFGEIGDALGTSPGAVRQALYEARRALSEMDIGRDMQCDRATRMVSDADGRPRDRGVRAHLRDCSPCRRFQAEITERGRTFAAISPMSAIAAAGALKAALGGSGAAAGGSGAAAVAGGAGTGASLGGVAAGSIGASALLKPAAGLLTVLAIGTAAVDHGAIFEAGRRDPATADPARSAPTLAVGADSSVSRDIPATPRRAGGRSTAAPTEGGIDSSSAPAATRADVPGAPRVGPRPRALWAPRTDREVATPTVASSPTLDGAGHREAIVPGATTPIGSPAGGGKSNANDGDASSGQTKKEDVPSGQTEKEDVPSGQTKKESLPSGQPEKEKVPSGQPEKESVPPGQAKKGVESTTGSTAPKSTPAAAPRVPPGQAKKETVPPGQAKKQVETPSQPTTSEAAAPAPAPTEVPAHVPPGQAKKEVEAVPASEPSEPVAVPVETPEATKVPPGQAKKQEAATE